jgi:putative transposase
LWGDRRSGADWRDVAQRSVTKQRMLRLMRAQQWLGTPKVRLQAKRTPTGSTPRPTPPNAWGGIDLTKGLVEGVGGV